MDATLTVAHTVIPLLNSEGGSNNRRFREIIVYGGALNAGTLNLRPMGTESTANLMYTIGGNFSIAEGAKINVLPAVTTRIANTMTLTVSGTLELAANSVLTLMQTTSIGNPTRLLIADRGNLILSSATINSSGNWSEKVSVEVQNGGRMRATDSLISLQTLRIYTAANFQAGDWSGNRFDTNLFIPHTFIGNLSAAGGGANNMRFGNIYIDSAVLASGTLELRSIGTETTANLYYIFNGSFTIGSGATVNVRPSVRLWTETASVVTVSGTLNFDAGSSFTLQQRTGNNTASQLTIANQGLVRVTSASFARAGNFFDRTLVDIQNGGRMQASNSWFAIPRIQLAENAVLNPGDWSGNRFDTPIYLPHRYIDHLSAAGGGADNVRLPTSTSTLVH